MGTNQKLPATRPHPVAHPGASGLGPYPTTELADDQGPIPTFPPVAVDSATGRILPMSPEELAARRDAALRTIRAIRRITDASDTEENWREIFRGIDAARPHRPLFEGMS